MITNSICLKDKILWYQIWFIWKIRTCDIKFGLLKA